MTAGPTAPTGRWRLRGWWVPLGILLSQLLGSFLIYGRGFPYFGSPMVPNGSLWELPVALLHLPALGVLMASGFCCGFRNGLVLTHVVRAGHIPMTIPGTAILAVTNLVCWLLVLLLARGYRAWRRNRVVPSSGHSG